MTNNGEKMPTVNRWTCPNCGRENGPEMVCPGCGFDESVNYLAHPTLTQIPSAQTRSAGQTANDQAARLAEIEETMRRLQAEKTQLEEAQQKRAAEEAARKQAERERQREEEAQRREQEVARRQHAQAAERTKKRKTPFAIIGSIILAAVLFFCIMEKSSSSTNSVTTGNSGSSTTSVTTAKSGVLRSGVSPEEAYEEPHRYSIGGLKMYFNYVYTSLDGITLATDITEIYFLDTVADAPEDAADLSAAGDRSVLCWTEGTTQYIAANGGVIGASSCENLFSECFQSIQM